MEGSDDELSDLEDVDKDNGKDELEDSAAPSAIVPPGVFDSSMDSDSDIDSTAAASHPRWTTTQRRNTINSFTSAVGPAVAISKSPLEVFQQFFTPELLDMIVQETNDYAKQVMGDEKFSK